MGSLMVIGRGWVTHGSIMNQSYLSFLLGSSADLPEIEFSEDYCSSSSSSSCPCSPFWAKEAVILISSVCLAKSQNLLSSSLQMRKFILISSFFRQFWPPTMSIIPGTIKANPKLAMPGVSTSMLSRWQMETVTMGSKQLATFRMKAEKILSTSKLPMMRLSPSMMDTQKTLTKFYLVKSPKTPITGSKENSLPPKKYPMVTRLTQRQMLQRRRLEKRGVLGMAQFSSKQSMARLPTIERRSPQKRLRGEQPRQKAKGFSSTGRLYESHMIITTPMTTRIDPPIQLYRQSSLLRNFRMEMKKNFNRSRAKVWQRAVSFSAMAPMSTQIEQFMEKMKCFCKFYRFSNAQNFQPAILVFLCSQSTKGMSRSEVMKIRQAERVLLSQRTSTVIQQGTMALLMELATSSSHATKELNSTGSQIFSYQSTKDSPRVRREGLMWVLQMLDYVYLWERCTSCLKRSQTEIDPNQRTSRVAAERRVSRRDESNGIQWIWLRVVLRDLRRGSGEDGLEGQLTLRKSPGGSSQLEEGLVASAYS